jgi:phage shock protein PspC (stress-responsive transcriptional regulator)
VIGPAIILAAVFAVLHVSIYVLIRGRVGARLPLLLGAAFLGAWAGDGLGARLGVDPVRIGDFHVVSASVLAWLGIGVVAVLAILGPSRRTETGSAR